MNLPKGATVGGFEIKTTESDLIRSYLTPRYTEASKPWACVGGIDLNLSSAITHTQTHFVLRVKSVNAHCSRGINCEIVYDFSRVDSVDTHLTRVINFSPRFLSTDRFKAVIKSNILMFYMRVDHEDRILHVENTKILTGEYSVLDEDNYRAPVFTNESNLFSEVPISDLDVHCQFLNLASHYYTSRPSSFVLIRNEEPTIISFDQVLSSNADLCNVPTFGVYEIKAVLSLTGSYAGTNPLGVIRIKTNGGTVSRDASFDQSKIQQNTFLQVGISAVISLLADTTIEIEVQLYENKSVVTVDSTRSYLSIKQVG